MLSEFTDRQWLWGAAGLYGAGLVLGTWSLTRRGRPSGVLIYGVIAVGYILQFIGMGLRGKAVGGCPLGNEFEMLQFTAWSAISLYLVVGAVFRSSLLGYFTSCLAAALTLLSLSVPSWDLVRNTHLFRVNPWIEFHAALALFSYGVFGLLSLTSAMFLLRHYSIKSKHLGGLFSFLPSIIDLDHIEVRLLSTGVFLLGTALAVGWIYWARDVGNVSWIKVGTTLAVWTAYAAALALRLKSRLLARRFAWTCLALFIAALMTLGAVDSSRHPAKAAPPERESAARVRSAA
jgi:HemX protein